MHNNIMYIDFMPMVSNEEIKDEAITIKRSERAQRQHDREKFCMYANAFLGAGALTLGVFALSVITSLL